MKSNSKKLVLGKETFKTLTSNQLAAVPSGAAVPADADAGGQTGTWGDAGGQTGTW